MNDILLSFAKQTQSENDTLNETLRKAQNDVDQLTLRYYFLIIKLT